MNEIEKAIETLQGECGCVELDLSNSNAGEKAQEFAEACHVAVEALREKAEREQGCEWCVKGENRLDGEDMEIELMHTLKKESRMVYPRFCPMCGRKLKED